jgi:integrase
VAKALTNIAIANVKPADSRREIPDGGCRGLYFIVQPTGRKAWAVRYRFEGKTRKMTLDSKLTLAEARRTATAALADVERGVDPGAEKIQLEAKREGDTVGRLAAEYIQRHVTRKTRPSTARATVGIFDRTILPAWRDRSVHDVRRRDVIEMVERVADDRPFMANRTKSALSKFFNWLASRDVIESSPCVGVGHPTKSRPRDRALSDDEAKRLLRACDALPAPFGDVYRLLLLTGARCHEVAQMRWREVDGDQWMLPAERSKNHEKHLFPLSRQARAIIERQPRIVRSEYVFGAHRSGWSHMKKRLDAAMRTNEPWQNRDLRRTVATGMQKLRIDARVIESALGHKPRGIVGVYQVHDWADEKADAYQRWADHVDELMPPHLRVVA